MTPIICKNDLRSVIGKIEEYLQKSPIKSIRLVDFTDKDIVLLVDNQPISQEMADIWWQGYKAALE